MATPTPNPDIPLSPLDMYSSRQPPTAGGGHDDPEYAPPPPARHLPRYQAHAHANSKPTDTDTYPLSRVSRNSTSTRTSTTSSSSSSSAAPTPRRRGKRGPCAGATAYILLSLLSLILLATPVAVLSVLYFSAEMPLVERIVWKGWAGRTVTVAGGVLAIGITLLSALSTGMLASLLRLRPATPDPDPCGLLMRHFTSLPLLRARSRSRSAGVRGGGVFVYVYLLITLTIPLLAPFAATVLLGDLRAVYSPGTPTAERVALWPRAFDAARELGGGGDAYAYVWHTRPSRLDRYPAWVARFGVGDEDANTPTTTTITTTTAGNSDSESEVGWDTGPVFTAFLPGDIDSDSEPAGDVPRGGRGWIAGMEGPLPVLSARYVCVRPGSLRAKLGRTGEGGFYLAGGFVDAGGEGSFNCSFATNTARGEGPVMLCGTSASTSGARSNGNGNGNGNDTSSSSTLYLLASIDGTSAEWETYHRSMLQPAGSFPIDASADLPFKPNKGWLSLANFEGGDVRLDITLCRVTYSLRILPGSKVTAESFPPHAMRLRLHNPTSKPAGAEKPTYDFPWLPPFLSLAANRSITFCTSCRAPPPAITPHPSITRLVHSALRRTRNPAAALQELYTLLIHEVYRQQAPTYDVRERISVSRFQRQERPGTKTGFWVVVGVLGGYLVVVGGLGVGVWVCGGWTDGGVDEVPEGRGRGGRVVGIRTRGEEGGLRGRGSVPGVVGEAVPSTCNLINS